MIPVFIPCFIGSALGKMEDKNVKNEMSSLDKRLSIEGGFKPSAHYDMNYRVVDQIRIVKHKFLSFFVLSAIHCTVVDYWAII